MADQKQGEVEVSWEYKPGETVAPGSAVPAESAPDQSQNVPPATPEAAATSPVPASVQPPVEPPAPVVDPQPEAAVQQDAPESTDMPLPPEEPAEAAPEGEITWTASEFIAHEKSAGWYGMLVLAALVLAAVVFLLTRDKISTGAVLVAALALAFYGARQPRQLRYMLSPQGLTIGEKYFPFDMFRSFAVMDEDHFSSIVFVPLKRFGQLTTIYFDPADEEKIVSLLSARLPIENRQHDVVDKFMKRIRF